MTTQDRGDLLGTFPLDLRAYHRLGVQVALMVLAIQGFQGLRRGTISWWSVGILAVGCYGFVVLIVLFAEHLFPARVFQNGISQGRYVGWQEILGVDALNPQLGNYSLRLAERDVSIALKVRDTASLRALVVQTAGEHHPLAIALSNPPSQDP